MGKLEYWITTLLAVAAVALDTWAFTSRCPASPPINVSTLSFGLVVQAIATGFPLMRTAWFQGASVDHAFKVMAMALALFMGSVFAIRYSVLYSDAIGKPNGFQSAGLACRSSG